MQVRLLPVPATRPVLAADPDVVLRRSHITMHVQEADGEYDHDEPFIECFSPEQEGVEWRRTLLIGSTEPRSQDVV